MTTFGTLTVLGDAEWPASRKRLVHVRCECGREKVVLEHNLKSGNTRSCGFLPCTGRWRHRALPPGSTARTAILLNYQSNARRRGRAWEISDQLFDELTAANCAYCGAPPSNVTRDRNGDGSFTYNGLDRVDSEGGYTPDNVVPACVTCNRAKTDMSVEEFDAWLTRAYERRASWPTRTTTR
jgi:5-methylcytosine-specific restriction endonuclease McrA